MFEAIGALEAIVAHALPELEVTPEPTPGEAENVNLLLAEVRELQAAYCDEASADLLHYVRAGGEDLVEPFERTRRAALVRLADMEALLVLFGAGDEADAEHGLRALPPMPEHAPGASVELDL